MFKRVGDQGSVNQKDPGDDFEKRIARELESGDVEPEDFSEVAAEVNAGLLDLLKSGYNEIADAEREKKRQNDERIKAEGGGRIKIKTTGNPKQKKVDDNPYSDFRDEMLKFPDR